MLLNTSTATFCILGIKWLYVSSAVIIFACPKRSCTILGCTRAANSMVACVCLKVRKLRGFIPILLHIFGSFIDCRLYISPFLLLKTYILIPVYLLFNISNVALSRSILLWDLFVIGSVISKLLFPYPNKVLLTVRNTPLKSMFFQFKNKDFYFVKYILKKFLLPKEKHRQNHDFLRCFTTACFLPAIPSIYIINYFYPFIFSI